jgi:hypothetical protein
MSVDWIAVAALLLNTLVALLNMWVTYVTQQHANKLQEIHTDVKNLTPHNTPNISSG